MLQHANLNASNRTFLAAFFAAVVLGHVRIAESFFDYHLNLEDLKDSHKPATLAAKSGSQDMLDLMIQEKCDVNTHDEKGWNALHFASFYGHYQIIDRLIESHVSAEASTLKKETPLLLAVKGSHFAVVEKLLRSDNDGSLMSVVDERKERSVHHVARSGQMEIFNLLSSYDAKFAEENSFGWQPLHIATAYGHLPLLKELLQRKADNIEEILGLPSVKRDQTHKIVEEGYSAEARWPYPGSSPLHLACEYGHYEIAKHLISQGAKLDAVCNEGWQPLHHATYIGSSKLVELLLESGANPHAKTNEGLRALALPFCTSGAPIPEEDKESIRRQLGEAMDRVKKVKPKGFKMPLKKASSSSSTVEDKHNLVRAATFSIDRVSKSSAAETKATTRSPNPNSTGSKTSGLRRPVAQHHPHTSPLPQVRSPISQDSPIPNVSTSMEQIDPPESHTPVKPDLERSDSHASKAQVVASAAEASPDANIPLVATSTDPQETGSHDPKSKSSESTANHTLEISSQSHQDANTDTTKEPNAVSSTEQASHNGNDNLKRVDSHTSDANVVSNTTEQPLKTISKIDETPDPQKPKRKSVSSTKDQPSKAKGSVTENDDLCKEKPKAADSTTDQPSNVQQEETPDFTVAITQDAEKSVMTRQKAQRLMSRGFKKARMGLDVLQRTEMVTSEVLTTIDDGIHDIQETEEKDIETRVSTDSKNAKSVLETEKHISTEVAIKTKRRPLGLSRLKSGMDALQKTESIASDVLIVINNGIQDTQGESSSIRRSIDSKASSTVTNTEKQISTQVVVKKKAVKKDVPQKDVAKESAAKEDTTKEGTTRKDTAKASTSKKDTTKEAVLKDDAPKKEKSKRSLGLSRLKSGLDTLQKTEALASDVLTLVSDTLPDQNTLVKSVTESTITGFASTTNPQASSSAHPQKKKAIRGLTRMTTGFDKGMTGLGNLGNKTMVIGNKTLEMGNKGLNQGLEFGAKGLDLGIQGLEVTKQGFDIVQGLEVGNLGLGGLGGLGSRGVGRKGWKGAKKAMGGKGKGKGKAIEGGVGGGLVGEAVGGMAGNAIAGAGVGGDEGDEKDDEEEEEEGDEDDDDEDDDDDDDDGDAFSMDGFDEFGSSDF